MYGDSHALSSDSNYIFPSNFKLEEEVASVNRDQQFPSMESDANTHYYDFRQQFSSCNNSSQNSSGLLRFRSAPTSLLANFVKGERLGSRFCSDDANTLHVLSENDDDKGSVHRFSAMNSQLPPQYPRQSGAQLDYGFVSGRQGQGEIRSSLVRQNTSPAGLFSHRLTSQNGSVGPKGIGSYRTADGGRLGMLSRIIEIENENTRPNVLDEGKIGNSSGGDNTFFTSGFPFGSWNDSSYFAENFTGGIKRELDSDTDPNLFVNTEKCEPGNRPNNILSHHLSLPKNSAEMAAMEKLLQLQDTVPCKVRAKRGCATHPRSIAERVRRTRISERMRKLQDLVPNMDKQTNTADMLDLAVDYIKNLQKQYKTLSDNRANCKCSAIASDQTH